MDTATEALIRAMLQNDWFTRSTGDVESPTGYFGYVVATPGSASEVCEAFSDTVDAYGRPADSDIETAMVASIDSNGIVRIETFGSDDTSARKLYEAAVVEYEKWAEQ